MDQLEQSSQQPGSSQRGEKIPIRQSVEKQEQQSQGKEKNFVQLHFVPVRPGHKEQQAYTSQPQGQYRRRPGHPGKEQEQGSGFHFPPEQGYGQFFATVPAFSLLAQIADQRDQFSRPQDMAAAVTMGPAPDNGFFPPEPVGTQIQEAAQTGAQANQKRK